MTTHRTAPTVAAAALAVFFLTPAASQAAEPEVRNLTGHFTALNLGIDNLQALEVGGIVVLRGKTQVRTAAQAAGEHAQALGFSRVANLIQVSEAPDDAEIARDAQRELAVHHSLQGSRISVDAENGIVYLRGSVSHELQKELAVSVLRSVEGVREVRDQLVRR